MPYLEVRAGNTFGNLFKKRFLDLDKLSGLDNIEYLLNLPEEHDLLLGAGLGPELEEALDDLLGEGGVLLQELDHAVRQLSMIKGQTAHLQRDGIRSAAHADTVTHLVKRNQDPHQELLVFRFQWQGEPINNRSEDLKKLSYSVKVFGLINKPEVEKEMRI